MDEWICTDPACNQYMKKISENVFLFKEDRQIDFFSPLPKYEVYEREINLSDYTQDEMYNDVQAFGYSFNEMCTWIDEGRNLDLIAECIFEMSND